MQKSMQNVVTAGIQKKPRNLRDRIARRVSHSERRGTVNSFIRTRVTNEMIVAKSATIGSTSFSNSGCCPMYGHYSSTGFSDRPDSPLGQLQYIICSYKSQLLNRRGGSLLCVKVSGERAWGQTHKNRKSNGVLTLAESKEISADFMCCGV